jgi:hypothetical protein
MVNRIIARLLYGWAGWGKSERKWRGLGAIRLGVWHVSSVLGRNGINPKSTTPSLPGIEDTWGTLTLSKSGYSQLYSGCFSDRL